ncbi:MULTISPECIES: metal ABC transporter substrate-binding protein [Streptomyces]|uniref:Metal transport ABC transporter substrate-binding protein n=1 Tax=Streptomyces griseus subsp. griseus (strain JCM 4626 / CBS 651.72 / NBRC 13350 / KCC S-0626 / ISP 5235) TaxID=455632 RepID=B1VY63_STRGG|nr:metal ABC transporter substrate-binding protein [Streptomyces griseus]MBW3707514.1 zinc ABC transporter substrate-binding protein [Streptomyces griseus]MYR09445.1 zinc ABC transporter solute-binding protein [Streptomyces sp. SID724]NEB54954.1 zinc ABC transporter substrate-binding protein [Streptomyces griseus]BAG21848.1 putative metal transport ABC transporter substrate-binding protein [Streptomyces griseus subsp. griseus NBRC 13350]
MNVRRLIPSTAVAGAVVLGLTALSACSTSDAADGGNGDKLKVTASFYPMQFLAEKIGGEHVAVTSLTKPGVEPHDLELTPRQIGSISESDYVLYLKGIQPAVDDAIKQSGVKNTVDAATLTTLENHGSEVSGHDHGEEGDEHGHEGEEAHEEHSEGDGHNHGEEGGADPHIWLDPVKYAEVAKGVGTSLEKADPDHAADYKKNTDALVAELGELNTAYETGLKNTATKTFITTHSAFGYLAERYGLTQQGIAGIDPEAEPSPARIQEIHTIAEKEKATTVFFETLASDRTAKTLAKDTGLRTGVLDPLEGITDKSRGADYIEVMESNLAALQKALGAK